MQRLATFLAVLTVGSAVLAQGPSELPGPSAGQGRVDLERLHRVADRAKPNPQVDPSRGGLLNDASRSRNTVTERFARQMRDKQPNLAQRFRERVRTNLSDKPRDLTRDKIQSRFERRADHSDPHRLALRQRLALIDRMRDEALQRQDWEALGRADQMERQLRHRFGFSQGNGIPMLPLPTGDGTEQPDFFGPGYGRLTAQDAQRYGDEFGQRVAQMARNRHQGTEVTPEFGNPEGFDQSPGTGILGQRTSGTGDGAAPGTGGNGDGSQLNPPPIPPLPPTPTPVLPEPPRPEYPRLPPEGGKWGRK